MTAKTLMVQGTASSVGKSLLVAALCRVFRQDGIRVAPFKSQNMALNSYVAEEGGEMGRAQVVQALAAGVAPSVDMNPILLKPEADHRSQVVVLGRPWGSMGFRDYRALRTEMLNVIEGALARLRAAYDLVIIEGAGSPAEINLRAGEIVNMRIARLADAPVLLVGDIDRGGVFAHLVGTLELLEPDDRARVKCFVINKFRGDVTLLQPGLDFLEQRTGVPVLGVVPYLQDLHIPEEDSVALESLKLSRSDLAADAFRGPALVGDRKGGPATHGAAIVDVAVMALPHIANFDDFDPLAREPGVSLRYVSGPDEFGMPDLVVIPGTKTTIADLRWLRARGLAALIETRAQSGMAVIGICGGYQVLGATIEDPGGVESPAGEVVAGLGLLPVRTVFEPEKATHRVHARVLHPHGLLAACGAHALSGYEIHMGRTTVIDAPAAGAAPTAAPGAAPVPAFVVESRSGHPVDSAVPETDGLLDPSGRILGTYLHGLFDNAGLRRALLQHLAAAKGLAAAPETASWGHLATLDEQFDRLAAAVRASLDMPRLYAIAGLNGAVEA